MSVDDLLRRNGTLATLDEAPLTALRSKMPDDVYLQPPIDLRDDATPAR